MGRDDLYITVPSFFRCPISLDVMKSPVSLCTGVTYDRSSIQRWLDGGNNTCPATMQVLQTKDFVPNHNLQRLIQIWSDTVRAHRRSDLDPTNSPPLLTQDQARELITQIQIPHNNQIHPKFAELLSKVVALAKDSDQNHKFLAAIDGFAQFLVEITTNRSITMADTTTAEQIFVLLDLVIHEHKSREYITEMIIERKESVIASMLFVLQLGNLAARIATARVLEFVATDSESKLFFAEHGDVLSELFRLVSSESDSAAIEAGLSTLICLSKPKPVRARIVRLGAVKKLGKLLSDTNSSVAVNERALKLLETVLGCREGRTEICGDEVCVSAIVRKMLKVSTAATEHAVAILWSLCYLFREQAAQEAVTRSNGVTKILLLMQSNCSPAVRRMAGDLLKMFGVKLKSCLSSYDTQNTHIMPF